MDKEKRSKRDEEILTLLETKSQVEVAEMFGMTQGNVGRILRKSGKTLCKRRLNLSKIALNIDYFKNIDEPKKHTGLGLFVLTDISVRAAGRCLYALKTLRYLKSLKRISGLVIKYQK